MSRVSRFVTTLAVSGAVTVAGLALGAGTVQADPFPAQPHSWCPAEALPFNNIQWDMGVCHTWYWVDYGLQANVGQFVYEGDNPPRNLGCIPIICLPGL